MLGWVDQVGSVQSFMLILGRVRLGHFTYGSGLDPKKIGSTSNSMLNDLNEVPFHIFIEIYSILVATYRLYFI